MVIAFDPSRIFRTSASERGARATLPKPTLKLTFRPMADCAEVQEITFQQALDCTHTIQRDLLLGNGFSIGAHRRYLTPARGQSGKTQRGSSRVVDISNCELACMRGSLTTRVCFRRENRNCDGVDRCRGMNGIAVSAGVAVWGMGGRGAWNRLPPSAPVGAVFRSKLFLELKRPV